MIGMSAPLAATVRRLRLAHEIERRRQDGYRLICQTDRSALLVRTAGPGRFWRPAGHSEIICLEIDDLGRVRSC